MPARLAGALPPPAAKRQRTQAASGFVAKKQGKAAAGGRSLFQPGSTKPELKYFDTSLSFFVDATAEVPATGQLNLVPQGTTDTQRVGKKIQVKSLTIKGNAIFAPGAAASAYELAYIYVVLDTQANKAAAAVSDVFTSTNLTTALMNLETQPRFRVVRKIPLVFNVGAGVSTAYNGMVLPIDEYVQMDLPIEFDNSATTGAITTIQNNNLFLVAGTTGATDDLITVNGTARIRFTDM